MIVFKRKGFRFIGAELYNFCDSKDPEEIINYMTKFEAVYVVYYLERDY